jgi:hypothetical protein
VYRREAARQQDEENGNRVFFHKKHLPLYFLFCWQKICAEILRKNREAAMGLFAFAVSPVIFDAVWILW